MMSPITTNTTRDFVAGIGDQHYAMSGVVIAAAAAQAIALGEACVQISFDNQADTLNWSEVTAHLETLLHLKNLLLEWADQEAETMSQQNGHSTSSAIYKGPAEVARLAIVAMKILQDFRPSAFEDLADDLEIAIQLLRSTASAALYLLNRRLNQGRDTDLSREYHPIAAALSRQLGQVAIIN